MKKGLLQLLSSNILSTFFGVINSFLLPFCLSVDSYASEKEFVFYMSYASILAFGYIEGAFIEGGGKSLTEPDGRKIFSSGGAFFVVEIIVSAIMATIGVVLQSTMIVLFAVGLAAVNIVNYYKNFCVAVGEYAIFSSFIAVEKIILLLLFLFLLFVVRSDNYIYYCISYIILYFIGVIYFHTKLKNKYKLRQRKKLDYIYMYCLMKKGFPFLISNFSVAIFVGLDRWFVNAFMGKTEFAMYSFAASMEQLINAFVQPVTNILYNSICRGIKTEKIKKYQTYLLIYGFFLCLSGLFGRILIELILPEYVGASSVIIILFVSQVFSVIVFAVYINYFKAIKESKRMLEQIFYMILLGGVLNFVGYCISHSIEIFAYMTLAVKVIWLFLCMSYKREYAMSKKDLFYTLVLSGAYLYCGIRMDSVIGFICGAFIYVFMTFTIMQKEVKELIRYFFKV